MELQQNQTENFQIFDLWVKYRQFWLWFVLSISFCVGIAALYIWTTPKSYLRSAQVMIITDNRNATEISVFTNPNLIRNLNVKNELEVFKSPLIVREVVRRLDLTVNYNRKQKLRMEDMYNSSPIKASFPGTSEYEYFDFQVEFAPDSSFILSKFKHGKDKINQTIRGRFHDTIPTPVGNVMISPTRHYEANWYFLSMEVSKLSISAATKIYCGKLVTALVSKENSIIRLECTDSETSRATDFLNMLFVAYNDNWLLEKNRDAMKKSKYLEDQIDAVQKELYEMDLKLAQYKSQHLVTDTRNAGSVYLTQSTELSTRIMEINSQISSAQFLKDILDDKNNMNTSLPFSGLGSAAIEQQIVNYNDQLGKRDELIANSGENNPKIANMNKTLANTLLSINKSVGNHIESLKMRLSELQKQKAQMTQQIASNPDQERVLTSLEREHKIKEDLFASLLQQKEANKMTLVTAATNTRLISPPTGSSAPVAPKKMIALMIALVFGVGIPGSIIWGKENLDITIRDKKDLENSSVPLLGVIPMANKAEQKDGYLLVRENGKDALNEAFRIIRTNLDNIYTKNMKVVMFTSLEPGSGKTFTALNLAMALALAGKKTVLLDMDMRTAALSDLISLPDTGINLFLNGTTSDEHFIMLKDFFYQGFDVIPVGIIPPNPTEMLMSDRFKLLIEKLRNNYDYIFLDSTPLDMVADATIIAKHTDITVFVLREGHTDRRKLPKLEEIFKKGHFKKMMMVLNGAKPEDSYNKHHAYYSDKAKNVALLPRTAYTPGKTKYLTEGTRK